MTVYELFSNINEWCAAYFQAITILEAIAIVSAATFVGYWTRSNGNFFGAIGLGIWIIPNIF